MCPLVTLQVSGLREGLATLGTGIRFLSGVDFHVSPQAVYPGEGLCTLGAGIRLGATMCSLVFLQVRRLRESLATLGAGIGFLPGVDCCVNP